MDREPGTQKNMGSEEMLEEFGALFRGMKRALQSFGVLYADIGFAMDDIHDEMERLREYLDGCAAALRTYSRHEHQEEEPHLPFRE